MKLFRVQFASGKVNLIKADRYVPSINDIFAEAILSKDGKIVARLNLEHVECIEEVDVDE